MITVEKLSKSFWGQNGPVTALTDVDLDLTAGAVTGVVGSSGSGKSTLARLVALQERPDSGVIRLDGLNTAGLDPRRLRAARRRIGVVQGDETLLRERTAAGNVAIPLEQAGVDGPQRREKVGQLLDLIGLTEHAAAYPDQLSAGQRRRVSLARALVGDPGLLLADEPTTGLDAAGAAGVHAVLDRARAELGTSVLVVTEDAGLVRRVADDVAVLEEGRIIERGGLLELVRRPDSLVATALLPQVVVPADAARHDRVAEVVLTGFAAVGALLPEAGGRFDADIAVIGGGVTRVGETPVARFLLGLTGEHADAALGFLGEHGATVRPLSAQYAA